MWWNSIKRLDLRIIDLRKKLIVYNYETEMALQLGVSLDLLVRDMILEAAFVL